MRHLLAGVILLFAFTNCRKSSSIGFQNPYKDSCDEIVHEYLYPLSSFPTGYPTTELFINYDPKGRVSELRYYPYQVYYYTYYKDSIVLNNDYSRTAGVSLSTLFLDKNGYVTSISGYSYQYSYDKSGYMDHYYIDGMTGDSSRSYDLIYKDGNLVSWVNQRFPSSRQDFTYFDKPAQDLLGENTALYSTLTVRDQIYRVLIKGGFFGKQSKSLFRTATLDGDPPAGEAQYQFDGKGRIVFVGAPDQGGPSYEYKCN